MDIKHTTERVNRILVISDIDDLSNIESKDLRAAKKKNDKIKDIIKNQLKKFKGIYENWSGQGFLVSFENVEIALDYAIAIQKTIQDDNNLNVRIGVNSGDILVEYDETKKRIGVSGKPINLTQRIERAGIPNSVLVSAKIHQDLQAEKYHTERIGKFFFEGMDVIHEVFAITNENLRVPSEEHIRNHKLAIYPKQKSFISWCLDEKEAQIFLFIAGLSLSLILFQTLEWTMQLFGAPIHSTFIEKMETVGFIGNFATAFFACIILFRSRFDYKVPKENKNLIAYVLSIKVNLLEEYYSRASYGINEFKNTWLKVWLTFFMLYIVLFLRELYKEQFGESSSQVLLFDILSHFANNLSAFFILICVSILWYRRNSSSQSHVKTSIAIIGIIIIVIIGFLELFLLMKDQLDYYQLIVFFEIVSGIFSAMTMGLLVGRLDSKLLSTEIWIIYILFGYVAIQPLFAYLAIDSSIAPFLLNYALFAKTMFFLYIIWLIKSKRMLYFLLKLNVINEELSDEWSAIQRRI